MATARVVSCVCGVEGGREGVSVGVGSVGGRASRPPPSLRASSQLSAHYPATHITRSMCGVCSVAWHGSAGAAKQAGARKRRHGGPVGRSGLFSAPPNPSSIASPSSLSQRADSQSLPDPCCCSEVEKEGGTKAQIGRADREQAPKCGAMTDAHSFFFLVSSTPARAGHKASRRRLCASLSPTRKHKPSFNVAPPPPRRARARPLWRDGRRRRRRRAAGVGVVVRQ